MFRTPSACAPSSIDSRPAIVMSRGVRCGIVSTPVKRSIATDAMIPLMRARARGLSFTSTNCALFEWRTALDGDDERSLVEETLELRALAGGCRLGCVLALAYEHGARRREVLVHGSADRGDLRGRRATAAADDPGAECARLCCELAEVRRRRVR